MKRPRKVSQNFSDRAVAAMALEEYEVKGGDSLDEIKRELGLNREKAPTP
jgi:hypothetical protein